MACATPYIFCIILKWLTAHCFLFGANVCGRTRRSRPLLFCIRGTADSTIFFLRNVQCPFNFVVSMYVLSSGLFCLATVLTVSDLFAHLVRAQVTDGEVACLDCRELVMCNRLWSGEWVVFSTAYVSH